MQNFKTNKLTANFQLSFLFGFELFFITFFLCLPIFNATLANFNPFVHSVASQQSVTKISILKLERLMESISYERRVYESVDDKSLS